MAGSFHHFNEAARLALARAQEEARLSDRNDIRPEDLLLGLLRETDGVVTRILSTRGVDPARVRSYLAAAIDRTDSPAGEVGLTERAKKVIELAVDEHSRLGHEQVGPEHLLLGLIREEEMSGADTLQRFELDLDLARAQVANALSSTVSAAGSDNVAAPEPSGQPFERFTERARRVVQLAEEEAARLNHGYIGTEHLLLGLVREGDGVAVKVLANLGIEPTKVRTAVEYIIGRGRPVVVETGLTPRARRVIELTRDEARRLGHRYIGTEHILLGLIREGEGIAAGILESMGVNLERARVEVMHVLTGAGPGGDQGRVRRRPAGVQFEYLL